MRIDGPVESVRPSTAFPRATKCLVKSWEMAMKWDWIRERLLRFYDRIVSPRGWRGGLETTGDDFFTEKARIAVETRDPRATPLRYDDRRSDFSQHIGC
jgi:hypothetical protein